jgi:methyl-accepting chemotaxis protein
MPGLGWLADRRVGTKILIALLTVAVVAVGVGGLALAQIAALKTNIHHLADQSVAHVREHGNLVAAVRLARVDLLGHPLALTAEAKAAVDKQMAIDDAAVDTAYSAYTTPPRPEAEWRADVAAFDQAWSQWRQVRDTTMLPLSRANDLTGFVEARDRLLKPLIAQYKTALDDLGAFEVAQAHATEIRATSAADTARTVIIVALLAGLALAIGLSLVVARMITRPLATVSRALQDVARGDLTPVVDVKMADEVGLMAGDLNRATASLRTAMAAMAGNTQTLAATAEELSTVSHQIASAAEETAVQAGVVAAASEVISSNVTTVATGSEEMGASISEIARNASEGVQVASQAVTIAATAGETITKLGDSSAQIGNVVKLITGIAEQTNLLALNATIEAARAGEMGKGFAVVASEVKDLAQETARATEDISARVTTIQSDTDAAITAIGQINEIISQINDYQLTIASAVEQQSATTDEMNRNVSQAAAGATEIAGNISGVATAAQLTSNGVVESQQAAGDLARMSAEMLGIVSAFRYEAAAAPVGSGRPLP